MLVKTELSYTNYNPDLQTDSAVFFNQHAEMFKLERLYTFLDYVKAQKFISDNAFLIPLLSQTYAKIVDTFGLDQAITLEVVDDYDEDDNEYLLITIHANSPANEVVELLSRFDNEWWLDALPSARHLMVVNAESYHV